MLTLILKLLLFVLWAPLVNGVIKKTKARLQRRVGPPVLQSYRDFRKFFRKQMVLSQSATWLFHCAPVLYLATTAAAALLVPVVLGGGGSAAPAVPGFGDMLLMVGILALGRFGMALAALESGSSFGGMGSSREMAVSAFVEPALLLTLAVYTLRTGVTGLTGLSANLSAMGWGVITPGQLLAAVALLIITVAETGRVPVDNPDTHLELTMIHEGMVLEYSGPYLAMITWSHQMKQLIMLSLLASLALPIGLVGPVWLTIPIYLAKTLLFGVLLAFIEMATAKVRILKIPDLLTTAAVLSFLAALSNFWIGG